MFCIRIDTYSLTKKIPEIVTHVRLQQYFLDAKRIREHRVIET